ncbi:hypothetical protein BEP19_09305 [Ammoniphilus oxalaticus]|uniref:HTH cro/C1-type domain-containing protein n=1 Tax=Ammoniphilus oxalaticus TaxID=66863 RepID=A0A419SKV7_9BACL|nr:helix-turn-helix transcriptional regulator [Ammoniphilus oxalaticus]RKD24566.1 hypothetical protein BEP19_09305 [Ammoniphilus oxalaticus]
MKHIGFYIRRARMAKQLTQEQLAERTGCSYSHIQKIEQRRKSPSQETLQKIIDVLGLTPGEVYTYGSDHFEYQSQLLQDVIVIMETDPEFVVSIVDAYHSCKRKMN